MEPSNNNNSFNILHSLSTLPPNHPFIKNSKEYFRGKNINEYVEKYLKAPGSQADCGCGGQYTTDDLKNHKITLMPCSDIAHTECLKTYIEICGKVCPVCSTDVQTNLVNHNWPILRNEIHELFIVQKELSKANHGNIETTFQHEKRKREEEEQKAEEKIDRLSQKSEAHQVPAPVENPGKRTKLYKDELKKFQDELIKECKAETRKLPENLDPEIIHELTKDKTIHEFCNWVQLFPTDITEEEMIMLAKQHFAHSIEDTLISHQQGTITTSIFGIPFNQGKIGNICRIAVVVYEIEAKKWSTFQLKKLWVHEEELRGYCNPKKSLWPVRLHKL